MSAREYVQIDTAPEKCEEMEDPQRCEDRAPETPNGYTDGSMFNPRGLRWKIGGLVVWWFGRKVAITTKDAKYAHHQQREDGTMF